jgi:hypothetical protein
VPQRVRCHVLAEPRRLHNGPEALVDPFNGSRLPLDQEGCTSTRDGVDRVAGNGPADPIWPSVNWRCLRWLPRRRRQHGKWSSKNSACVGGLSVEVIGYLPHFRLV